MGNEGNLPGGFEVNCIEEKESGIRMDGVLCDCLEYPSCHGIRLKCETMCVIFLLVAPYMDMAKREGKIRGAQPQPIMMS